MILSKEGDSNNNALHLAGDVAHLEQIYRKAGAALQMQRELQWFKEVERLVLPKNREERNKEAHNGEDLSEKLVLNEVRLSKGEQNPYPYPEHLQVEEWVPNKLPIPFCDNYVK
ncbi:hypothetical protein Vadar_008824 [Vaccinium darrowii]|uniref:Uncharacterized protein n=1 Tax=Vaccinium darrowii TaxID=229202 RepID=A0ACB7XG64_9ERIC|nr:hypothetical protein Vadar_008824 [Vaccinium darrowii]